MKVICINCSSEEVVEQVQGRGIFTRKPGDFKLRVVSWEPIHDFYECSTCGHRWVHGEISP